ncbi:nitroreductase [Paenibacillus sp. GCM10023252]|uniref:nitroreductase family protein n=1 Tax=Paenibacillus sp. GCM10023252 TaxID=3252649 RepID=UPI003609B9C6
MSLEEAIRTRRTIGRVKKDPVERAVIEKLLEAACWAPCHHHTEPWRFIVMTGEGRAKLGEGYARVAMSEMAGSTDSLEERLLKEKGKAYRAPVVIAVICSPSSDAKVNRIEELAAAHAATQNLLLAAHADGLGAIWRSGDPMYHPLMKETFGLQPQEEIVALVYLGYPELALPAGRRTAPAAKTTWLEE